MSSPPISWPLSCRLRGIRVVLVCNSNFVSIIEHAFAIRWRILFSFRGTMSPRSRMWRGNFMCIEILLIKPTRALHIAASIAIRSNLWKERTKSSSSRQCNATRNLWPVTLVNLSDKVFCKFKIRKEDKKAALTSPSILTLSSVLATSFVQQSSSVPSDHACPLKSCDHAAISERQDAASGHWIPATGHLHAWMRS